MKVCKQFIFHAAHHLPLHKGKCRRPHGHTYTLEVCVAGDVKKDGLVIDFEEIKEIVEREIIERLDHRDLNEIIKNPSAEIVVMWIWDKLRPLFEKKKVRLVNLKLWESPNAYVEYSG